MQADYTGVARRGRPRRRASPQRLSSHPGTLKKKAKWDDHLPSLPRMDELPPDIDGRISALLVEAFNGVVMRMALLSLVLGAQMEEPMQTYLRGGS